jgi:hypothetical protein
MNRDVVDLFDPERPIPGPDRRDGIERAATSYSGPGRRGEIAHAEPLFRSQSLAILNWCFGSASESRNNCKSTVDSGTLAELRGWAQFIGLQIEYSLIERTVERELIPMSKALNLGVLAWSPYGERRVVREVSRRG